MPHEPTDSVKDSLRQRKLLWAIGLFALLVGPMPGLSADCVQPSSDVVDGVTIRAAPTTSGALRGKLKPGEQLPLIASVSGNAVLVSKRGPTSLHARALGAKRRAVHRLSCTRSM